MCSTLLQLCLWGMQCLYPHSLYHRRSHAAAKGFKHLATAEKLVLRLYALMMSSQQLVQTRSQDNELSHKMDRQRFLSGAQLHMRALYALLY